MSTYFESLDSNEKINYTNKLKIVGLMLDNDPYIEDDRFKAEMSIWPPVEFGHIFAYFIQRPGTYTMEQLLSWKQLEGYNYFKSNYVRTVYVRVIEESYILKASVNPSQRTPDKYHQAWVMTKADGNIVIGHCTCMAG